MCAGTDSDMKKWIMAMTDAIKGSSGSVCILSGIYKWKINNKGQIS